MTDESDASPSATEVAFTKAAEMERDFYTRREIAEAFRTVADELEPRV